MAGDTRIKGRRVRVARAARLSQAELANLVGATRESINKWIRFYERHGVLERRHGQLALVDSDRLRADIA